MPGSLLSYASMVHGGGGGNRRQKIVVVVVVVVVVSSKTQHLYFWSRFF